MRDFSTQISESLLLNIIFQLIKLFIPAAINCGWWHYGLFLLLYLFVIFKFPTHIVKKRLFFLMVFSKFNVMGGRVFFLLGNISFREYSFWLTLSSEPQDAFFSFVPWSMRLRGFFPSYISIGFLYHLACVTSKWSRTEKSMSCLGIDLFCSQVAEKSRTVNWKLHLVLIFLIVSQTLALARTLQRQATPQAWKKSLCWDKGWGAGRGHRTSLNAR